MNDNQRFYAAATLAVILFLALFGGAGLWVYAERRGAGQWRAEAQKQKDSADLALRELSSSKHALDELRGESSRQRAATEALAAELRTELAAHRELLTNAANPPGVTRTTRRSFTAPTPAQPVQVWDDGLRVDPRNLGGIAPPVPANGRNWGPEQATGKPDTPGPGDQTTAWASRTPDEQQEWLILDYAEAVDIIGVNVYETYNPGALVRVTAFDEKGKEIDLWSGVDPTPRTAQMGTSEIKAAKPVRSKRVKLYIDSPAVPGWNEIDAVGILDAAGKTQWAVGATASSTFAQQTPAVADPFMRQEEQILHLNRAFNDAQLPQNLTVENGQFQLKIINGQVTNEKTRLVAPPLEGGPVVKPLDPIEETKPAKPKPPPVEEF